jgi:hypothetical protein
LGNYSQTNCLTIGPDIISGQSVAVVSNFYVTQSNYSTMINPQLGYQASVTATAPGIGGTYTNLVSATIPTAGVWLVEGSFQGTITNASATIYILSLSTTTSPDFSRAISRTISIQTNYTWYDHITSVFVLTAPTTIRLLGILFSGSSSASNNSIRYTKIG